MYCFAFALPGVLETRGPMATSVSTWAKALVALNSEERSGTGFTDSFPQPSRMKMRERERESGRMGEWATWESQPPFTISPFPTLWTIQCGRRLCAPTGMGDSSRTQGRRTEAPPTFTECFIASSPRRRFVLRAQDGHAAAIR